VAAALSGQSDLIENGSKGKDKIAFADKTGRGIDIESLTA